MMIEGFANH